MSATLGLFLQVLPLSLAAAISPTFFALQMAVLTSPAPGSLRRGWALALGSMSMLLVLSFGGLSLLAQLPDVAKGAPSLPEAVILAVAGLALLVVAARERNRPPTRHAGLLTRIVDSSPPVIFGIGALRLLTNATTLALYIPALHVITQSTVDFAGKAVAFLVLFVVTELAVLGPVVAVTLLGERAKPFLTRLRDGLEAHSKELTVALCAVFGLALLGLAGAVLVQVL